VAALIAVLWFCGASLEIEWRPCGAWWCGRQRQGIAWISIIVPYGKAVLKGVPTLRHLSVVVRLAALQGIFAIGGIIRSSR